MSETPATPRDVAPKGTVFRGPCNRTACQKPGAEYWNYSTRAWYCAECANAINGHSRDMEGFDICWSAWESLARKSQQIVARDRYGDSFPYDAVAASISPASRDVAERIREAVLLLNDAKGYANYTCTNRIDSALAALLDVIASRDAAPETPAAPARDAERTPPLFMVFDVESVGLHGEGFAVGYVVVDATGHEHACSKYACLPSAAAGDDDGRAWLRDNLPPMELWINCGTPREVRDKFWADWQHYRAMGAVLVSDCGWPVEARFLAQCVGDDPQARYWQGPYPLHDLASASLVTGADPLATNTRLETEQPPHDPLADARQSARLWTARLSSARLREQAKAAEAALEQCLAAMDMQEKRQSGEFHITGETANCIWQDAKSAARAALAGADGQQQP